MIKTLLTISYGCALILLTSFQTNAQVEGSPRLDVKPTLPSAMKKSSLKISEQLSKLYESYATSGSSAAPGSKPPMADVPMQKYMQIKGDRVLVDITVKEFNNKTRVQLENMGVKINAAYGRVVSGTVPIASIPSFEAAGIIVSMRASLRYKHSIKSFNTSGSNGLLAIPAPVIGQGDTALRSYLARKYYGVTGNGVKIGILSDSYNNLGTADIGVKNGELPGPDNPYGYKKPVQVLLELDDSSGTDEGRGMAEIVHDIAPGAEMAFYSAYYGEASFADGIIKLAEAGCKVIIDDIGYVEPFFQDGIIAQAIDRVKKMGVTYFSAAGNEGDNSYESNYRPSNVSPLGIDYGTAHNFAAPGNAPIYLQPVFIPTNREFASLFEWDQPFFSAGGEGSNSDLDIFLLNSSGQVVAAGFDDNIGSGDAYEILDYFNTTRSTTFFILILKYDGPDPTRVKCINLIDYTNPLYTNLLIPGQTASTIFGHANAEGAIATGTANYNQTPAYGVDTPKVVYYSSVGGLAILFDGKGNRINPILRKKPEITSVDGGNTSFFYADSRVDSDTIPNFFGTSAAAPHAAGLAALMMEAQRLNSMTPSQIKGIMSATAIDMDSPYFTGFQTGFDWATGAGFLKADAAVGAVKFPNVYIKDVSLKAACSDNPAYTRNWVISNPNPFDVEVHWLLNGFLQQGTVVAAPGETTFTTQTVYFLNRPAPNVVIIDWNDNLGIPHFDYAGSTTAKCGQDAVTAYNTEKVSDLVAGAEAIGNTGAVSVYPNPVSKNFRVSLSLNSQEKADISLYTLDGRLLLKKVVSSTGVTDIDATSYAPGMYVLKVQQKNFNKTFKLVKK